MDAQWICTVLVPYSAYARCREGQIAYAYATGYRMHTLLSTVCIRYWLPYAYAIEYSMHTLLVTVCIRY